MQYTCTYPDCGLSYDPADWCPNGHGADTWSDVMIRAALRDKNRKTDKLGMHFTLQEVVQMFLNLGIEPKCGACMEIAFTGATTNYHTCETVVRPSASDAEAASVGALLHLMRRFELTEFMVSEEELDSLVKAFAVHVEPAQIWKFQLHAHPEDRKM